MHVHSTFVDKIWLIRCKKSYKNTMDIMFLGKCMNFMWFNCLRSGSLFCTIVHRYVSVLDKEV